MTLMRFANRGDDENNYNEYTSGIAVARRPLDLTWLALAGALVMALMIAPALSQDTGSSDAATADAAEDVDPEVAAFLAEGDVEAGKAVFKKCDVCHDVGEKARDKPAPNLNGIFGRAAGAVESFKYSNGMTGAAENGLVWSEAKIFAYIADPRSYLREVSGNPKAKAKMPLRLKKEKDRSDVIAYLKSVQ